MSNVPETIAPPSGTNAALREGIAGFDDVDDNRPAVSSTLVGAIFANGAEAVLAIRLGPGTTADVAAWVEDIAVLSMPKCNSLVP
jgi:hypothetical protein